MEKSIKIWSAQNGVRVTVEIKKATYEVEVVIKPKAFVGEIYKNRDFYYKIQMLNGEEQLEEKIVHQEKRILIKEEIASKETLVSFILDGYCKVLIGIYSSFFRSVVSMPRKKKNKNKSESKNRSFKHNLGLSKQEYTNYSVSSAGHPIYVPRIGSK